MQMLLPAWYDVVWSIVALTSVGLFVAALTAWSKARHDRGGGVLDLVVLVMLPVIGPAAYLTGRWLARRRSAPPAGGDSGVL